MDRPKNWYSSSLPGPSSESPVSEAALKRLLAKERDLDNRLAAAKRRVEDVGKSSTIIKLECELIDRKRAVVDTEARLREELKDLKMKDIVNEECKKIELEKKKYQAEMILEKEKKTFAIHYDRMNKYEERYKSLWKVEDERIAMELDDITRAEECELIRMESLKEEIRRIYEEEEFSEDVDKIRRDIMIAKKRNAALLLRLTKKAEHLEEQLKLRKG